jgi:hypothetical protein
MGIQQVLATFRRHRQLLPLLMLTAYSINAIVAAVRGTVVMAGDTYNFELTTKHYVAFGAIGLNFVTYWLFRPYYKYTLVLTITGGLFNLMTFPALETTQNFTLSSLKVSFQPSAFFAGLLAYLFNFKRINEFVIDNLTTKRTQEEQDKIEKARFQESVGKFKEKYGSYSVGMLREIVNEKKFVPEAIEAAKYLLKERQRDENAI